MIDVDRFAPLLPWFLTVVSLMTIAGSRQCRPLRAMVLAAILAGCKGSPPAPVENPSTHLLVAKLASANPRGPIESWCWKSPNACMARFRHTSDGVRATAVHAGVLRGEPVGRYAGANGRPAPGTGSGTDRKLSRHRASASAVPADLRLNTELIHLQQNFMTRPSHVDLALRAQLIDVRSKRVIASRLFDETENAPSDDAYGGVTAANSALQRVLEQIAEFCVVESDRK